jgi:hypothetical protein
MAGEAGPPVGLCALVREAQGPDFLWDEEDQVAGPGDPSRLRGEAIQVGLPFGPGEVGPEEAEQRLAAAVAEREQLEEAGQAVALAVPALELLVGPARTSATMSLEEAPLRSSRSRRGAEAMASAEATLR